MNPTNPIVHIVDDDESFRTALARQLRVAGHAVQAYASAAEFLRSPTLDGPGCVVLDLSMPHMGGLECQKKLAALGHPLPVVFLTGRGDIPTSVQAMRAGAEDFLTKTVPGSELLAAVRRALERGADERRRRQALQQCHDRLAALSYRERQVLALVMRGMINKEIAAALGITERTVKFHRSAITRKLGIPSIAGLTFLVQEAGGVAALGVEA